MKQTVLIFFAILIASVSMAQFERTHERSSIFNAQTSKKNVFEQVSFDEKALLIKENNKTRNGDVPVITINFEETPDASGALPYGISFANNPKYSDVNWKIDHAPDNPHNWKNGNGELVSPMFWYYNEQSLAKHTEHPEGKFAFINSIAQVFHSIDNKNQTGSRLDSYMTLGPLDIREVANPLIKWKQLYKKHNSDSTFIAYSTNGSDFTELHVNVNSSGLASIADNALALPASAGNTETFYLRFIFRETTSITATSGGGYGWQVDDIQIFDNSDYDVRLNNIVTNFYFPDNDPQENFHTSSTYGRIPKEEFENGARIYFATTFTNMGVESISPNLTVTVTDPKGDVVYKESHQNTENSIASGMSDTLYIPAEKSFTFVKEGVDSEDLVVPTGKYIVKYELSIPGEGVEETKLEDNSDETYFYITANGEYGRDLDKINAAISTATWENGGKSGEEVAVLFNLFSERSIHSASIFIAEGTKVGNEFEIVIYRLSSNDVVQFQITDKIEVTQEMIGKWNTFEFEDPGTLIMEGNYVTAILASVKIYYNTPESHIYIGADRSTKASFWGFKWRFANDPKFGSTSSAVPAGLCLRLSCIEPNSILENQVSADVNIYPNPANDFVNIQASEEITSIEVLSTVGTSISKHAVNDNVFACPTSQLSNGTYIVKIYTKNGLVVKQFSVLK